MGANFISKTAVTVDNGPLRIGAQVVVTIDTTGTGHAIPRVPTQPGLLADLKMEYLSVANLHI